MIYLFNAMNDVTPWLEIACGCLVFGAPAAWLARDTWTGRRRKRSPSTAQPAAKAVSPEPEPFDAGEWEKRYAAGHVPRQRGRQ